jgi:hypothetical protein
MTVQERKIYVDGKESEAVTNAKGPFIFLKMKDGSIKRVSSIAYEDTLYGNINKSFFLSSIQ